MHTSVMLFLPTGSLLIVGAMLILLSVLYTRAKLAKAAGLKAAWPAASFSVEQFRKSEELKATPEWKRTMKPYWAAAFMAAAVLMYAAHFW